MKKPKIRGCFLVGCGPSLNRIDIRRLASIDTISFNRSYIAWERWGFRPTYYACFDPEAVSGNAGRIQELIEGRSAGHFFLHDSAASFGIRPSANVTLVKLAEGASFSTDLDSMADFGNVGASSLQILAALGYRKVAMVGVDARYLTTDGLPGDEDGFVRIEQDKDHFDPEYLQRKKPVDSKLLERVLGRWPRVAAECRDHGLEVKNCSPGSALTCFEQIRFDEALAWIAGPCRQAAPVLGER